jgi:AraC-like DNA-binding protein
MQTVWNEDAVYAAKEVAGFFGVSPDTVRRIFRKEAGVFKFGPRHYRTLRIPGFVVTRVARTLRDDR